MRKNIFERANEKYNVLEEAIKLDGLFHGTNFFLRGKEYTFEETMDYLWPQWSQRGATLSPQEFMEKSEAWIGDEENIVNYLEAMENFIYFCFHDVDFLKREGIVVHKTFFSVFVHLVRLLEQQMGLSKKEFEDYVLLYPENAPLEKVLDVCSDDTNVQWELIRYSREDLSLYEKRKSLAILATNLYIEEDNKEKEQCLNSMIRKATNILNNLHIRHNNKTGKYMSEALSDIDEDEAKTLCDYIFNLMLIIVLLRKQPDFEKVYQDFHNKQKAAKNKKAGDENND